MNASQTMIRRASELDVGSRVIIAREIHTVVRVHDLPNQGFGAFVTLVFENNYTIVERASTLYTCV